MKNQWIRVDGWVEHAEGVVDVRDEGPTLLMLQGVEGIGLKIAEINRVARKYDGRWD